MPARIFTRRKTRQALLEHERLTSLINNMGSGVVAIDQRGKVVLSNGAALNILDVNSSLRERPLADVLHLYDKNNQPVDVDKLIKDTVTPIFNSDYTLKYSDGSTINLFINISPVHLGYGKRGLRGYVLVLRDVTHEKSLEEERDEFISVVSHELRTPIAIAEGNVSNAQFIVDKTGDITQVKQALKQAHEQILFLAGLMNDLATLSRAERGKLEVSIDIINTRALVESLAQTYADEARAKHLEIKTTVADDVPSLLSCELYVREILQNFITNSIKYTDTGSVTIGAKLHGKGVLFSIKDTGIGISKSDQEKIFDKFFRSEDYRTRKTSGTGLGLYVTLKLARILHAEIDVQSKLDHGSTFSIYIPHLK
jgi:PAS domain S-box-containing protein